MAENVNGSIGPYDLLVAENADCGVYETAVF